MEYLSAFATSKLIMTDSPTPPTTAAFHKAEEDQPLLGRIAVHYDMITKDQLAWALREQSHEGGMRKLGDILVAAGLITSKQLQQLILAQQELVAQQKSAREAATDQPSSASTGAGIDELLQMAVEQRASDLHIHSGSPLRLRIQGDFLT
ncbi:MAG: hypothetical protein WBG64_12545, partial [Thermoanaerobaculia bacterium]